MKKTISIIITIILTTQKALQSQIPSYIVLSKSIIIQKPNLLKIRKRDIYLNCLKTPKNSKLQKIAIDFLKNILKHKKYSKIEIVKRIGNLDLVDIFLGKMNLNEFLVREGFGFSGCVEYEEFELSAHQEKKGFWGDEYRSEIFKEECEDLEEFVF